MRKYTNTLKLTASTGALVFASSFLAAQAQDSQGIEQVVVSASRVTIAGYSQPTPVTVVGAAQLEQSAYADIGDSIRDLPSVGDSSSASNGTNAQGITASQAGASTVNLRNLGIIRTLVLFDGQRVVQSNTTGGVDLATIPTSLVQRVDVVTGGASASWGSDAVAGVVNLILNKNFTGFKANIEGSDNAADTYRGVKTEASWGEDFAGGRGHFIISGAYTDNPDTVYLAQAKWAKYGFLFPNPAYAAGNGQPQFIPEQNAGQSQGTPGGIITASPKGTTAAVNSLVGIQFLAAGQAAPFSFGNVSGSAAYGGSVNAFTGTEPTTEIAQLEKSETLFGYGSYRLTDTITASVQLNFGHSFSENTGQAAMELADLTVNSDNAYLPATVQAAMAAGGITSFTMGTLNTNNASLNNLSVASSLQSLGIPVNYDYRQMARGVVTLTGALGNDWGWNVYYQHGESRVALRVVANTILANMALASDAVTVTAANRGTSGLAIGSVACRSTLTAPTNLCQPLDVFGTGVASAAGIYYANHYEPAQNGGVAPNGLYGNIDYSNMTLNQDVASGSMQGTLPWQLPAGPVAVAFGAEYRKEGGRINTSPLADTTAWASGNFRNFAGQYEVAEGFAEVDAPLLKNNFVQSLDFQGAGRMTSYSTSGLVETWKLGLNSQVTDDFKLRTTWSYDIRAPDLSELFASGGGGTGAVIDPKTGKSVSALSSTVGNPNLNPESSTTISGGVVLTPTFIPGLSVSLDWYSINIKGYIYSLSASQEAQQCALGLAIYCSDMVYNGAAYPGALGSVIVQPANAGSETTSGLDFQADYPMDLFSGRLNWHLVGNYTDELTLTAPNLGTVDYAGSIGPNSAVSGGVPKFKATLSATYVEGSWSGTVQTRMEGAAALNNAWTSGVQVPQNTVPFNAYLDFRGSYRFNDNIQFYGAIDNFLDTPPPEVLGSPVAVGTSPAAGGGYEYPQSRLDLYDGLGRSMRVGIRFNF